MSDSQKKSITDSKLFSIAMGMIIIAGLASSFYYTFENSIKVSALSRHISEVVLLSDNLKQDYGCYPTAPSAFTDLSVFKNPEFNSCNKAIDIENAYSPSFSKYHKPEITNNHFKLVHSSYEATGMIKIIGDKIVYNFKVSDNERTDLLFKRCTSQHGQRSSKWDIKNYKTISFENPCGKDVDGNLLLLIGTIGEDETWFDPNAIPRQIANDIMLSML